MLGPFELVGSFDTVGLFERVASFDLVGPFEQFYIACFNNMQPLKLNSSSCCIFNRCQTISNKKFQFNRTAQ